MKKPSHFVWGVLLCTFTILCILKLSVILNRQFDPDELSYLHWAYLLFSGKLPYKDFFFFITPLFPALLSPLFLLPHGSYLALLARLSMFGVYLGTLWILFLLVKAWTQNKITAVLTVLLFFAFPMTFDKTIEIRPDMVMTLFFLIGIYLLECVHCQTEGAGSPHIDDSKKTISLNNNAGGRDRGAPKKGYPCGFSWGKIPDRTRLSLYLASSGIFFSLSFLTMFKIVFAVPAILFLLLYQNKKPWQSLFTLSLGFLLPIFFLFLYLLRTNLLISFFHSITYDALIANVGNSSFPIWMTFSPWKLIYVQSAGVSIPWLFSTLLWLLTIPGILLMSKKYQKAGITLGLLLGGTIAFAALFPKPYVQYFIIPSLISAISVSYLVQTLAKKQEMLIVIVTSLLILISFGMQTHARQTPLGTNQEQLLVLDEILQVVRPNEPVYDMVGSYVFRPDGFYICCHAYIQFADLLKPSIPSLSESLILTKTKFLVMDQKGYVFWIAKPDDLAFLTTHYLPSPYKKIYTLGSQFQCTNSRCIQLNVHGTPISDHLIDTVNIIIEERYKLTIQPPNQHITISNSEPVTRNSLLITHNPASPSGGSLLVTRNSGLVTQNSELVTHNQSLSLSPGTYHFTVPPSVTAFSLHLDR